MAPGSGTRPRRTATPVSTLPSGKATKGTGEGTKGAGRAFLPAPVRARSHGGTSTTSRTVSRRSVLVVRKRQSRFHLFVRYRRWGPEVRRQWKRVERDCDWVGFWGTNGSPSFQGRESDARRAKVFGGHQGGQDARLGFAGGGPDLNEELEEVELWAPEEGPDISESSEVMSFFCFSLVQDGFSFLLFGGIWEGEQGRLTLTARAVRGRKRLIRKARRCPVRGSGFAAAMALRAPCSGL